MDAPRDAWRRAWSSCGGRLKSVPAALSASRTRPRSRATARRPIMSKEAAAGRPATLTVLLPVAPTAVPTAEAPTPGRL
eukprot:scaffold820_cov104-Isochrysis_galbana.AAC.2